MYRFHYGDEAYQLVEADDLVVIRTEAGTDLLQLSMSSTSRDMLPHLVPVSTFPEANVTVYKIVSDTPGKTLRMRNAIRRELTQEEGIRYAGRALRDPKSGTVFVYTENIFVQFKADVPEGRCLQLLQDHNLRVKDRLPFAGNAYFAAAPEGTGLQIFAVANELLTLDEVQTCHPELIREKKDKFIHPMQWHLRETSINGQYIDEDVSVEEAWQLSRGDGVIIAVIDDGFDVEHLEFQTPGKVVAPRNTVRNSDDARPTDPSERHGTACAGVACAAGVDKASGVAPDARLMPIKSGGLGSIAEAKAFAWAADQGADVISCSWGPADGPWYDPLHPAHTVAFALPDSTRLAIEYALDKGRDGRGCVICWAAGNGNEDIRFDGYATHSGVIAVAACNDRGRRSVYSDFGEAVWCCFPSNDFYAPHLNHPRPRTAGIWTTDRRGPLGYNGGGISAESVFGDMAGDYTATFGGTSSACPGVAGVCALMLAVNPNLSWREVKNLLRQSCDRIDEAMGNYSPMGHSPYYGYGRVNAARAVRQAQAALAGEQQFRVEGCASFQREREVALLADGWTGAFPEPDRLLGLRLRLAPFHSGLGIRYWLVLNDLGPSAPAADGDFAGTRDRRRKAIGIAAELTGPLATGYDLRYQARLSDREEPAEGRNGAVCGKASGRGEAVEQVRFWIERRAGGA